MLLLCLRLLNLQCIVKLLILWRFLLFLCELLYLCLLYTSKYKSNCIPSYSRKLLFLKLTDRSAVKYICARCWQIKDVYKRQGKYIVCIALYLLIMYL